LEVINRDGADSYDKGNQDSKEDEPPFVLASGPLFLENLLELRGNVFGGLAGPFGP
jgi:hypothetical protein